MYAFGSESFGVVLGADLGGVLSFGNYASLRALNSTFPRAQLPKDLDDGCGTASGPAEELYTPPN